ncbi:hypothetical protein P692DRAFT_201785749 [Suillus brevipes Sb2]|nr:hypothetical protein P692DRAFT_201785749 [Suillus brevipes Sb2]
MLILAPPPSAYHCVVRNWLRSQAARDDLHNRESGRDQPVGAAHFHHAFLIHRPR